MMIIKSVLVLLLLSSVAVKVFARSEVQNMKVFKKSSPEELKKKLTKEQFDVTQNCGTEPPFKNAYWNHHEDGIYVDVTTGEPLFSSLDKYDSGTGWPSFTKPLEKSAVVEKIENDAWGRTEIRSKIGDSHLGHVFGDGPGPEGTRYCMNSAALRFIPVKDLEKEGYGQFTKLFDKRAPAKK